MRRLLIAGVVVLALVAGLWLWLGRKPEPTAKRAARLDESSASAVTESEPPDQEPEELEEPPAPVPAPAPRAEEHAPAHAEEPSHPTTTEHERIQRENRLIAAMNDFVDLKEGPALRVVVENYKREFPEDTNKLGLGYGLIAECLDRPTAAVRAAAQRYYDVERASTLRRYIRRYCLDGAE